MPKATILQVRCPVCGASYGLRPDQPLDRCRLPNCGAKVQLEKVKAETGGNAVQYGKPLQNRNPHYYKPTEEPRYRWRRRKKPEVYDPPRGKTLRTPAEVGEIRGPDPVLLQPESSAVPAATVGAAPAASGGLSFGMIIFIGLMVLLIAGIAYMVNSVWGDGGSGGGGSNRSGICAEMRSKIESVGTCYGQGYCKAGWSYCDTKPYGMPWGDGCIPNECR